LHIENDKSKIKLLNESIFYFTYNTIYFDLEFHRFLCSASLIKIFNQEWLYNDYI